MIDISGPVFYYCDCYELSNKPCHVLLASHSHLRFYPGILCYYDGIHIHQNNFSLTGLDHDHPIICGVATHAF